MTLFIKMITKKTWLYVIIFLTFINTYVEVVLADELAVGDAQVTNVNKNVDYPGNYEDVSISFSYLNFKKF